MNNINDTGLHLKEKVGNLGGSGTWTNTIRSSALWMCSMYPKIVQIQIHYYSIQANITNRYSFDINTKQFMEGFPFVHKETSGTSTLVALNI